MKKIEIRMKEDEDSPEYILIDGERINIDTFFLLTKVDGGEVGHMLAFGNSNRLGQMIYNFYISCISNRWHEMAFVFEEVATDIIIYAKKLRGQEITLDALGSNSEIAH